MSALRARGVTAPMRSAKAPTKAAPEAVSATVKRAPAGWEPTWLVRFGRSGRRTTASPSATLVISRPRWPANGTAWVIACAIASKSVTGWNPIRRGGSAALELGVARALLEEGAEGVLQVLGGEQLAGVLADGLVGGRHAAFAEAAQDVLGHRLGAGRASGQLGGEGARALLELRLREDRVDDAPALHLLGAEQLAGHHELAGAAAAGALGEALGAAHRRRQPDHFLDQAEPGLGSGDDQVAGEGDLEGRRQRQGVGGEDDRRRQPLQLVDRPQQVVP